MAIPLIRNLVMSCAILLSGISIAAMAGIQDQTAAHLPGTNPVSGGQLYKQYCAVCHGIDLTGHGPLATELKTLPADLTTLAQRHGGKFPDEYVKERPPKRRQISRSWRLGYADLGAALRVDSRNGSCAR